jgi:hypothetical protein
MTAPEALARGGTEEQGPRRINAPTGTALGRFGSVASPIAGLLGLRGLVKSFPQPSKFSLRLSGSVQNRAPFRASIGKSKTACSVIAMSNGDVYRKRAVECQRQADAAVTESVRETLHDIADKYRMLAANEERSGAMLKPDADRPIGVPPQ